MALQDNQWLLSVLLEALSDRTQRSRPELTLTGLNFPQDERPPRQNNADEPASLFRGVRCPEALLLPYYPLQ